MSNNMSNTDIINKMIREGTTMDEALKFFDSLEPIKPEFMIGKWNGSEIKTGHIMEGLLEAAKWKGEEFKSINEGYPLVFELNKQLYYGDPIKIFKKEFFTLPRDVVERVFPLLYVYIKTNESKSRLRVVNYRDQDTASMVYDQVPIIDSFKKVDENTVMGVMDSKLDEDDHVYFFALFRK